MRFFAWVPLLLLLAPNWAEASCNQAGAGLGCFDASPGQGPAEPSRFQWFSEGKVVKSEDWALTLNGRYEKGPLRLAAPSGMPEGRIVNVVSETTRLELRAAWGLGRGLDVGIAAPVAVHQSGTGSESLSSQDPSGIDSAGLGDLRLALRSQIPWHNHYFDWTLRLELTVPTGNDESYLGAPSATEAVTTNLAFRYEPLLVVADLGGRVSQERRFADTTIGPHLLIGLGVAIDILSDGLLTAAVEAQARPMLSSAPEFESTDSLPVRSHATRVIPAEWILSVSSRPTPTVPLWFSLGAGTALPLSSRTVESLSTDGTSTAEPRLDDTFVAPTASRLNISASVATLF